MQSGPTGEIRLSEQGNPLRFGPGYILCGSVLRKLVLARAIALRPLTLAETDHCAQEAFSLN